MAGGPSSQLWADCRSRPAPTGSRATASTRRSAFSFAHELSPRLSLGYNVGAAWESSGDQRDRDAFIVYSLVLGVGLTDRLGTFLELFGDRQTTGTTATSVSVDGGLTFLLTDIVQLDVYVGGGLRGPTDDVFFGTGLSFRLPR